MKKTNKQVNMKDQKELKEIIATLDNIPDPIGPLEPLRRRQHANAQVEALK